jgi:hypothetical protein
MVGMGYKDFTLTFTYDVTISTLKNYNGSRGAYEFSLIKQGVISGDVRDTKCPTFKGGTYY